MDLVLPMRWHFSAAKKSSALVLSLDAFGFILDGSLSTEFYLHRLPTDSPTSRNDFCLVLTHSSVALVTSNGR